MVLEWVGEKVEAEILGMQGFYDFALS